MRVSTSSPSRDADTAAHTSGPGRFAPATCPCIGLEFSQKRVALFRAREESANWCPASDGSSRRNSTVRGAAAAQARLTHTHRTTLFSAGWASLCGVLACLRDGGQHATCYPPSPIMILAQPWDAVAYLPFIISTMLPLISLHTSVVERIADAQRVICICRARYAALHRPHRCSSQERCAVVHATCGGIASEVWIRALGRPARTRCKCSVTPESSLSGCTRPAFTHFPRINP
jgi:hypothetical protein